MAKEYTEFLCNECGKFVVPNSKIENFSIDRDLGYTKYSWSGKVKTLYCPDCNKILATLRNDN